MTPTNNPQHESNQGNDARKEHLGNEHAPPMLTDLEHISKTFLQYYPLPDDLMRTQMRARTIPTPIHDYTLLCWQDMPMITLILKATSHKTTQQYCTTAYILARHESNDSRPLLHEILIWLPTIKRYGYYDGNKQQLFVYPHKSWGVMEPYLPAYLLHQKDVVEVDTLHDIATTFDPIHPNLMDIALTYTENNQPDKKHLDLVKEFTIIHGTALLTRPFCSELHEAYWALSELYRYLSKHSPIAYRDSWGFKYQVLMSRIDCFLPNANRHIPGFPSQGAVIAPNIDAIYQYLRRPRVSNICMAGWTLAIVFCALLLTCLYLTYR